MDVETTGGRAGLHRMTDIGAVKVQNGQIINEFQTLLNPERSIPAFITKLTGITQDMVKDAPLFGQIADDFSEFLGDAIFAAHNVNFDYGFIKAEYDRIGKNDFQTSHSHENQIAFGPIFSFQHLLRRQYERLKNLILHNPYHLLEYNRAYIVMPTSSSCAGLCPLQTSPSG